MAYKTIVGKSVANRMAALDEISAALLNMGWTAFDVLGKNLSCAPADVNTTNETLTIVGHTFVNDEHVMYSVSTGGTVIAGLANNTMYYIVSVSGDTFKLSATQGGAAINLTSQGAGTHYIGEGERVYSSDGEAADRMPEFVRLYLTTAAAISVDSYAYWAASTHSGLCKGQAAGSVTTPAVDGQFYLWVYGNKNLVAIHTKVATTFYHAGFGHLPKRFWSNQTTLSVAATAGSSVSITVTSTANFWANNSYQIVGALGEGRDRVIISAITDSTHMVIQNLPRNYGIGARIGQTPSVFGNFNNSMSIFYDTCQFNSVGTGNAPGAAVKSVPIVNTNVDPDNRGDNNYMLQPIIYTEDGAYNNALGYIDEHMFDCAGTGMTTEDTLGVGLNDRDITAATPKTGTASAGSANTLSDATKAWSADVYIGKVVVIQSGTGAGQIRKISDNTDTTLAVVPDFVTNPSTDSVYGIYDEAYRLFTVPSAAFREGV